MSNFLVTPALYQPVYPAFLPEALSEQLPPSTHSRNVFLKSGVPNYQVEAQKVAFF